MVGLRTRHPSDRHGHDDDSSAGLILNARLYECSAAAAFLGRRRRVYDDLVALSGAQPGDRVLDVGCGTGYLTRRAARAVAPDGHVTGVDPSAPVIDYARRSSPPSCTFQLAGAEALPHPDASFDVAVSILAIHHIALEQRAVAMGELYRVLRPSGRLLIADFRPPRSRLANQLISRFSHHAMAHNPIDQLARLITDAGFRITGRGDRRPWLHYVQAQRPSDSTAPDRTAP